MNLIAVDIGNTNIDIGLFLKGKEQFVKSVPAQSESEFTEVLKSSWENIPFAESSKEKKRDGVVVVSSVKPESTKLVEKIAKEELGEKIYLIGKNIPLPMDLSIAEPEKIGIDRVVSAAAAYAVVEDAVVIADFGSAVTIDLVDQKGVFVGGIICPGFEMSAAAFDQARSIGLPWRMLWYQFGPYEAYYQIGRYEDVIVLADVTLQDRPYFEESYFYMGLALDALGQDDQALSSLEQAVRFNPNFEPAALALEDLESRG